RGDDRAARRSRREAEPVAPGDGLVRAARPLALPPVRGRWPGALRRGRRSARGTRRGARARPPRAQAPPRDPRVPRADRPDRPGAGAAPAELSMRRSTSGATRATLRAMGVARVPAGGQAFALVAAGLVAGIGCGADLETALAQRDRARELAADLRVELHRSAEAAQRAVMAETDEASAEAAREAEEATGSLERDLAELGPVLARVRFAGEERLLDELAKGLAESREVDGELLGLAVENTNLKAQRLSFGPAREAADAFRDRLADAVASARGADATRAELLAARAELGVREIQALQAPHIAAAEDPAMTRLRDQTGAP